jgi:hypothetical protein
MGKAHTLEFFTQFAQVLLCQPAKRLLPPTSQEPLHCNNNNDLINGKGGDRSQ